MNDCYIVDVVRCPTGKRNGSLSGYAPAELGGLVLNGLLAKIKVDPKKIKIDDVIVGCVSQVGAQTANIGRGIVFASSLPVTTPATTVDRQCGSSLQALHLASQAIWSGQSDCIIAGGIEVMSQVPLGAGYDMKLAVGNHKKPTPRVKKPTPPTNPSGNAQKIEKPQPKPVEHKTRELHYSSNPVDYPCGVPVGPIPNLKFPFPCLHSTETLPTSHPSHHTHPFSIEATSVGSSHTNANNKWFFEYNPDQPFSFTSTTTPIYITERNTHPLLKCDGVCTSSPHYAPPAPFQSQFVGSELVARKYGLCKCSLLHYSRLSMYRAINAWKSGVLDSEVVPVPIRKRSYHIHGEDNAEQANIPDSDDLCTSVRKSYGNENYNFAVNMMTGQFPKDTPMLTRDETMRPVSDYAVLDKQRALPNTSSITAAMASQISDGASMCMVVSNDMLKNLSTKPSARVISSCVAAGDPVSMLDQVISAAQMVIEKANKKLRSEWIVKFNNDSGFVPLTSSSPSIMYEINEAFATVPLSAARVLGIAPERLNVHGGAIALGHPLGATGVKLIGTVINSARVHGCKYAIVSICEGGGMANAILLEVFDQSKL